MRHTIITGGSSGIGLAIGRRLAGRGGHVTILGRDPSKLAAATGAIEACRMSAAQQVLALPADVSSFPATQAAIATAAAQAGPPDLLITSAGIGGFMGRFEEAPLEAFERVMAVNYFGSLYAVRAVLPSMQSRHSGHICLISSGAGLLGIYGYSVYAPTKFALRGLADTLRSELRREGIGVSIAYPPDTDTPMLHEEIKEAPPETRAIAARAGLWSAEAVANAVIKGIDRRRFEIALGAELKLLRCFRELASPALHWYLDRLVEGATKQSAAGKAK
jgi:3-dehydrosphinganine reductase